MLVRTIKTALPIILLAAFVFALWIALNNSHKKSFDSQLIGSDLPNFSLPDLFSSNNHINSSIFKGKVSLINVWASWCYACETEQATLINITKNYPIYIYGVNYKDDPEDAKAWLRKNGNPFKGVIQDQYGELAIDLGVIGTPETFVISPYGKIVYRHVGIITDEVWQQVLLPIIRKYQV